MCIRGHSWAIGVNLDITDTPIQQDSTRFISNIVQGGGRGATGLNRTSTVSNRGRILGIRSSTVVNRSAAVMNRSGSVAARADTVGASWDIVLMLDFLFFQSRCTPILPSSSNRGWIVMNRSQNHIFWDFWKSSVTRVRIIVCVLFEKKKQQQKKTTTTKLPAVPCMFDKLYIFNESNRKAMNTNWSNHKAKPALKTKMENNQNHK